MPHTLTSKDEFDPQKPPAQLNENLIIDTLRIEADRRQRQQDARDEEHRQRQASHDRRMLGVTVGLLVGTLLTAIAALYQAHASAVGAQAAKSAAETAEKTLLDMKTSGEETKVQIDRLIAQQQRTADSMDRSLERAKDAIDASKNQARAALDASANALFRELRPYVSVGGTRLAGEIDNGKKFSGTAQMINSGRTPALDVEVCGDIFITLWDHPITDEHPCPSPGNPQRLSEGENSVFVLGAGIAGPVSSPGTTITVAEGLANLLSTRKIRLYFYGYIRYLDTLRRAAHTTTFCGMYGAESKSWTVCEKHNRMD